MKHIRFFLLATAAILFITACEKDENGNRVTYYKTIGEGYIYDGENNRPLKDVTITMESSTSSSNYYTGSALSMGGSHGVRETINTDENGYYKIRFLKRINGQKVNWYSFSLLAAHPSPMLPPPPPIWFWSRSNPNGLYPSIRELHPEDIKDKKVIIFDTVKYYPSKTFNN